MTPHQEKYPKHQGQQKGHKEGFEETEGVVLSAFSFNDAPGETLSKSESFPFPPPSFPRGSGDPQEVNLHSSASFSSQEPLHPLSSKGGKGSSQGDDGVEHLMRSIQALLNPSQALNQEEEGASYYDAPVVDLHRQVEDHFLDNTRPLKDARKEESHSFFKHMPFRETLGKERIIDLDKTYVEGGEKDPWQASFLNAPYQGPLPSEVESFSPSEVPSASAEVSSNPPPLKGEFSFPFGPQLSSFSQKEPKREQSWDRGSAFDQSPEGRGFQHQQTTKQKAFEKEESARGVVSEKEEIPQEKESLQALSSFVQVVQDMYQAKKKESSPKLEPAASEGTRSLDSFLQELMYPLLYQWIQDHPELMREVISVEMKEVIQKISQEQMTSWIHQYLAPLIKERIDHQLEKLLKEAQEKT